MALPLGEARALLTGRGQPGPGLRWAADYPTTETLDAVRLVLGAYAALDVQLVGPPAWWTYQLLLDGEVVGDAGFHGPPGPERPVEVEIAYAVVPSRRGSGVGTRACGLLLDLAWRQGAEVVRAETEPDNLASQAVLRRNGFVRQADGSWLALHEGPR